MICPHIWGNILNKIRITRCDCLNLITLLSYLAQQLIWYKFKSWDEYVVSPSLVIRKVRKSFPSSMFDDRPANKKNENKKKFDDMPTMFDDMPANKKNENKKSLTICLQCLIYAISYMPANKENENEKVWRYACRQRRRWICDPFFAVSRQPGKIIKRDFIYI